MYEITNYSPNCRSFELTDESLPAGQSVRHIIRVNDKVSLVIYLQNKKPIPKCKAEPISCLRRIPTSELPEGYRSST